MEILLFPSNVICINGKNYILLFKKFQKLDGIGARVLVLLILTNCIISIETDTIRNNQILLWIKNCLTGYEAVIQHIYKR